MKCPGTVYPDSIALQCTSHSFEAENCCHKRRSDPYIVLRCTRARLSRSTIKNGTGGAFGLLVALSYVEGRMSRLIKRGLLLMSLLSMGLRGCQGLVPHDTGASNGVERD